MDIDTLKELYYNPALHTSLRGARALLKARRKREGEKRIREWLSGEDAYTLHKKVVTKFKRRPTIVAGIGEQLQVDLMDVRSRRDENNNTAFLLTAIDSLSRKGWAVPLINKSGPVVARGLRRILEGENYKALQSDKGKEFDNVNVKTLLAEKKIKRFTTENETIKASMVERFNRTLKEKIYRYLTYKDDDRYIDVLPEMVNAYNNTIHGAIGMRPNDVNFQNQELVWNRVYEGGEHSLTQEAKLKIGDYVRISKARGAFERGYTPNWTIEIFIITDVLIDEKPVVYRVKDLAEEMIDGTFYEKELQKVKKPTIFRIEKILGRRMRRGKRQILVKWLGYGEKFNEWVDE